MRTQCKTLVTFMLAVVIFAATASAQQAPSPPPIAPYGTPLGLEAAKKVMAAAEAEAVKNNWAMAIVILDSTGHMVMLHKLDNTEGAAHPSGSLQLVVSNRVVQSLPSASFLHFVSAWVRAVY